MCAKCLHVNVSPCLLPEGKGSSGQFAIALRAVRQPCSVSCVLSVSKVVKCCGDPLSATLPAGHLMGRELRDFHLCCLVTYTHSSYTGCPVG